jgi:hypothetical protein
MGDTRRIRLLREGKAFTGEALLETAEIVFRGETRIVIPFSSIRTVEASGGQLILNGDTTLELGEHAAKWAEKIRNPKSVVQKVGVKPGQTVAVLHVDDRGFVADLEKAGAKVALRVPRKECDVIFYGAESREDLDRLATLKRSLAPNGALWVIRPKGVKTITEGDVMAAGRLAGLVDVKVVKFSETHTAEKFVIPVALRSK